MPCPSPVLRPIFPPNRPRTALPAPQQARLSPLHGARGREQTPGTSVTHLLTEINAPTAGLREAVRHKGANPSNCRGIVGRGSPTIPRQFDGLAPLWRTASRSPAVGALISVKRWVTLVPGVCSLPRAPCRGLRRACWGAVSQENDVRRSSGE